MSRFEMSASKPEEIQFELRATMTLKEWMEVRDALKDVPYYGAAGQLRQAIRDAYHKANECFRPSEEEESK